MFKNRKIVITTGGTGGHVFPAEALAKQLLQDTYDITFMGGKLSHNRYFHRHQFKFKDVIVSPLFQLNIFKTFYKIIRGIFQSLALLKQVKPDLVIGFGSFYTFPVLVAAKIRKIPIVLFESNAIPGKVTRLFSWLGALCSVHFHEASRYLSGPTIEVNMPTLKKTQVDTALAREYFYLDPHLMTILVFGGSQGAEVINVCFSQTVSELRAEIPFQIIHIAGTIDSAERLRKLYASKKIPACVKAFEEKMNLAWSAANVVICRSGAATIAEQISYAVPGVFIPFAKAADDHQTYNAIFAQQAVQGSVTLAESELTPSSLKRVLQEMLRGEKQRQMKEAIIGFNLRQQKEELYRVIANLIQR